jgi:hypothetical protein
MPTDWKTISEELIFNNTRYLREMVARHLA